MIPVVEIKNGLRQEGLGYGLPMVFITLGKSNKLEVEDILREVLSLSGKRSWVCITSIDFDTLSFGIGTLVKGLSQLQRYVEVETDGLHRDPSWAHTVDRWVVNFQEKPVYNLNSLRASDTIRIQVPESIGEEDFPDLEEDLEACSKINCVKYLVVPRSLPKTIHTKFLKLIAKFERIRLY